MRKIFYLYVIKEFLFFLFITTVAITTVILLSSVFETMRITSGKDLSAILHIKLVTYKIPSLLEKTIALVILISSTLTLNKFKKSNELIVARSFGLSTRQLILPICFISFLVGLFIMGIFNPISSYMLNRYKFHVNANIKKIDQNIAISENGIWFTDKTNYNMIVHAGSIDQKRGELHNLTIYMIDRNGLFERRIEASEATLLKGTIYLSDGIIYSDKALPSNFIDIKLDSKIDLEYIKNNLTSPEAMNFWQILKYSTVIKKTGFSNIKYSMYFYRLLILPLFLINMVIIAGIYSLRLYQINSEKIALILTVSAGFLLYYCHNLILAFGTFGSLSTITSTIIPVILTTLILILILFNIENG